ncbi:hypothetical protein E2C01_070422 [Portunus trituberculatus]|uniref:Uncharacterized protein n=1 Tax=Portunus trituberculatus TaxID=210409 RepID=A0A5B7HSN1_PORTR|nr:hypothetical protein [Portunus trituberculatus]
MGTLHQHAYASVMVLWREARLVWLAAVLTTPLPRPPPRHPPPPPPPPSLFLHRLILLLLPSASHYQ